jgi:hypothetical protein
MKKRKSLTIWTITLSFFIIVGAGHGIGCVGLIEIISIAGIVTRHVFNDGDFTFSLTAGYEKSLIAVGIFSLIGHILLLISLILKENIKKALTKVVGLTCLWTAFYYLTHNFSHDELSQIGFFTGLPFLICSIILAYRIIKEFFLIDAA